MPTIDPTPTKRFHIDPLRVCTQKCEICYHLQSSKDWHKHTKPIDEVKSRIMQGIGRGNNYFDITGGEPMLYDGIEEIIKFGLDNGARSCMITNGTASEEKTQSVIDAGLDGFMVSRHGTHKTYDNLVHREGAHKEQMRFLGQVKAYKDIELRFNVVICQQNQSDLLEIAADVASWSPNIVNFINFNPHNEWINDPEGMKRNVADLSIVEPQLNKAIGYLEHLGIGVNVRYYPMCRLAPEYRRTVCNDLHVMFDPYEWDYLVGSNALKNIYTHLDWGMTTSNNIEEKDAPCNACGIHRACGGVNKLFHKVSTELYGERMIPQEEQAPSFYYYRKHNAMTLIDR